MKILVLPLCFLVTALAHAQPTQPSQVSAQYDFAYRSSDERVQVFDDGIATRLQLPEGTVKPIVLTKQSQGERLLSVEQEGPYYRIGGVYANLILRWSNRREVSIAYQGDRSTQQRAGPAAAFGAATLQSQYGAVDKPVLVQKPAALPTTVVEQVQVEKKIEAPPTPPVPPQPPAPAPTPVTPPAPVASWRIQPSDITLSSALSRWATQAGYQVLWQAEKDLPALGATYSGNFDEAVEAVMTDTRHSNYPLHACLYDNKLIRVIHASQSCTK